MKKVCTATFAIVLALASGCSSDNKLLGAPERAKSSPSPDNGAQGGASGGETTDAETAKANPPNTVTGAFLAECGFADEHGTGCVIVDAQTKKKVASVQDVKLTTTYRDGSTGAPAAVPAPSDAPWHVYFMIPAGKRVALTKMTVAATLPGYNNTDFSQEAASLVYDPNDATRASVPAYDKNSVIIFTTKNKFTPAADFTSADQADQLCNLAAKAAMAIVPARSWKALIAVDGTRPAYRWNALLTGVLYNSLNQKIGADPNAMYNTTSDPMLDVVSMDETGHPVARDGLVWTGTQQSSGDTLKDQTCSNWGKSTGTGGTAGLGSVAEFLEKAPVPCTTAAHLYCVTMP